MADTRRYLPLSEEPSGAQERTMKWSAFGAGVVVTTVVTGVALAALGAISAKIAAGVVQLLGIGLTVPGVAMVRSWLEKAGEAAVETQRGLARCWGLRCEHDVALAGSPASPS